MSTPLLDVNVLIALVRSDHVSHKSVARWFQRLDGRRWATCPLTEAGFVRIITNPRFLHQPPEVREAIDMLRALAELRGHQFWTMDAGFAEAVEALEDRLFGHQQVTDAYLLALSIRNRGRLATLDRATKTLAASEFQRHIELIE